tara:strand:- start:470 stop:646 length:177 start_codon:yes stop_codon:yes gene_type:complete
MTKDSNDDDDIQVYQRPWVGLTKDERLELYRQFKDCLESDDWEYEKAIEDKLKERNHG